LQGTLQEEKEADRKLTELAESEIHLESDSRATAAATDGAEASDEEDDEDEEDA
jgi:hypothetical protein